jgi:hypothetical protein
VDAQTARLLPAATALDHAIATIHRQVDRVAVVKSAAGSTGSRLAPVMIAHLRSRTGRIQARNRRVIAVDGSASLPTRADARTIALPVAEMRAAANRSWNSISPLSLHATRLLTDVTVADSIVATAAVPVAETAGDSIAAVASIAIRQAAAAVAVMIGARLPAVAAVLAAAATAMVAVEIMVAVAEIAAEVAAVGRKAEVEDLPAPGLARVVQKRCS